MEIGHNSLSWTAQQSEALQRMREGGGDPGFADAAQIAGMSGRQILEAMMQGRLPYPPMNDTLNMTLLEVGEGRAVFQGIALRQHCNPLGTVHGGWFATLLDSALGCAIQTVLPPGQSCTTVELSLNIVRAATPETGPLRATAKLVHGGNQLATAEARIEDEKGRLYAHATTSCFILRRSAP